jgi:hypothetical protein
MMMANGGRLVFVESDQHRYKPASHAVPEACDILTDGGSILIGIRDDERGRIVGRKLHNCGYP